MSCNSCNCNPCNCYPSIPTQWKTCPPTYSQPCPPAACPPAVTPAPPFPFDGIYTQFARVLTNQANFFGMPAVERTLVAAPGAGKMIIPIKIFNALVVDTIAPVAYEDILTNTPNLAINQGTYGLITDASILSSLADQTTFYALGIGTIAGNLANQPITLTTNVQSVIGNSNLYTYIVYTTVTL